MHLPVSLIFFSVSISGEVGIKVLGKSTLNERNFDGKNTTVAPSVLQKNNLNNNVFWLVLRLLLIMIEYYFKPIHIVYIIFGDNMLRPYNLVKIVGIHNANFSTVVSGTCTCTS